MKTIYQRAIDAFGVQPQLDQAQEECAELIVDINHLRRGRLMLEELGEEVADVSIMVEQLRLIVGPEKVANIVAEKLGKLEKKLDALEAPEVPF